MKKNKNTGVSINIIFIIARFRVVFFKLFKINNRLNTFQSFLHLLWNKFIIKFKKIKKKNKLNYIRLIKLFLLNFHFPIGSSTFAL